MNDPKLADYRGARGSNAGDEFHELWALEQILRLLDSSLGLNAVTVEGIPAARNAQGDRPYWDGVDCGLFYGGDSLETANRLELVQLKYSGDPRTPWSLARLTKNSAKKGNNSVLRKLADDFKAARSRMKTTAELRVRFVSNQSADKHVIDLMTALAEGSYGKGQSGQQNDDDVETFSKATGLTGKKLSTFAESLDFSECGSASRFYYREKVITEVARLVEDAVALDVPVLRQNVSNLMLPERHGEHVTRKTVLAWFNVADEAALFPSPPKFKAIERPILREPTRGLSKALVRGERFVCLHGPAGCGKTTSLQQLSNLLPDGSCLVLFDSYGGGSYLFADDRRHLPENAFLQIANDLARELGTPFLLPRDRMHPIDLTGFLRRVRIAADILAGMKRDGLLVVAIDAADNSVVAAERVSENEPCFVHQLNAANLGNLPPNVRIVISARTARIDSLHLPRNAVKLECPPFSPTETTEYVRRFWPEAPERWMAQFHRLSNGIPRVQSYAIESSGVSPEDALALLMPQGKILDDVLRRQFELALDKLGNADLFNRLVAALSMLPPPIPPEHLAAVAKTDSETVDDVARDLSPALRIDPEGISIADEDVEDFLERQAGPVRSSMRKDVAEHFLRSYGSDAYAATHIGDALIQADLGNELLQLVEQDAILSAIADPVVRREAQVRRLRLALNVCRGMGDIVETLKVVLISADAHKEESALREVLEKEIDLAVHFAWPTLRRLVLADRSAVEKQGSVLAQDAARATHLGERLTAWERLASHDAWLKRRNDIAKEQLSEWVVTVDDLVARAEATLLLSGTEAMLDEIKRWRPRTTAIRTAIKLVPALIAAGKEEELARILDRQLVGPPWDILVMIPLAMAGRMPDAVSLANSLSKINRRHIAGGRDFLLSLSTAQNQWEHSWFELILIACELAVGLNVDPDVVLRVVRMLRAKLEPESTLEWPAGIDGQMRTWLLDQHLNKDDVSLAALLESLHLDRQQSDSERKAGRVPYEETQRREELSDTVRTLFPIYTGRISLLTRKSDQLLSEDVLREHLPALTSGYYRFDHNYRLRGLRSRVAGSIMQMLIRPVIPHVALFEQASALIKNEISIGLGTRLIPLLKYLLLRRDAHPFVVATVADQAQIIQQAHWASSEKVASFLTFSRILLHISINDAKALFSSGVELTKDMDQEAFDQIELLARLGTSASSMTKQLRLSTAAEVFRFVSGAAERLSSYDDFPWEAAVTALTRLASPLAVAAIGRWADVGTADLETTLRPFLHEELKLGEIKPDVVAALAILLQKPDMDLVTHVLTTSRQKDVSLADELARDCLLQAPPRERLALAQHILAAITEPATTLSAQIQSLRATAEFMERLANLDDANQVSERTPRYGEIDQALKDRLDGMRFSTTEAIRRGLDIVKAAGSYHFAEALYEMGRRTIVADRVDYLNALADLESDTGYEPDIAQAIVRVLDDWKGTPAVEQWRSQQLPELVIRRFAGLGRGIKERYSRLADLLDAMHCPAGDRLQVVTRAVEASGLLLNNRDLYGVAEIMVRDIPASESAVLFEWYIERLGKRLPLDFRHVIAPTDVPESATDSIGRFLFAQLGDIDTRARWRSAHALRRLARLGATSEIDAVIANWSRTEDPSYRDPDAPYYWLAARLWLVMTLERISSETPKVAAKHVGTLVSIALDPGLPHLLLREYAKRAILRLAGDGLVGNDVNLDAIGRLNEPRLPRSKPRRRRGRGRIRRHESKHGFQFDTMDTIPYWYEPAMAYFPGLRMEQFLDKAEEWILAEWKARPNANWWDPEPRKARYNERQSGSWLHRHGESPIVERYGTYLEWHAMMCVVGELLETHPIDTSGEYGWTFDNWFARFLPTEPNFWLSDVHERTPLEARIWVPDSRSDDEWLRKPAIGESAAELGLGKEGRKDWIIVGGSYHTQFRSRGTEVNVWSALVSPETAISLTRALQTVRDPSDFRIPWEDDELQIDAGPYRLIGWLEQNKAEMKFDEHDPLRNQARLPSRFPGRLVRVAFSLSRESGARFAWKSTPDSQQRFVAEVWSDLPQWDDEWGPRPIGSTGWRLWMRRNDLQTFLSNQQMDLLYEVRIDRRIYDPYARSYERDSKKKSKSFDCILLCRADGRIETASGRSKTWKSTRRRTRT